MFENSIIKNKIALWFFPKGLINKELHENEEKFLKKLSNSKYQEYSYSRGYLRYALGDLFNVNPLKVPIESIPGAKPKLQKGWGYISLSHCDDAIIVGWSSEEIGIDIERKDRNFSYQKICKRFYSEQENINLKKLSKKNKREFVLENWIMKESAFKCQNDELISEFFKWEWDRKSDICFKQGTDEKLKFTMMQHQSWSIGVASSLFDELSEPIICIF